VNVTLHNASFTIFVLIAKLNGLEVTVHESYFQL